MVCKIDHGRITDSFLDVAAYVVPKFVWRHGRVEGILARGANADIPGMSPHGAERQLKTTAAHWGLFTALEDAEHGTQLAPHEADPQPGEFWQSMVPALSAPSRLTAPLVRTSYLEHGPGHGARRTGNDGFTRVSWDRALDLVAGELERVRSQHGNQAIYGGSYGWASAGRFHHAQSQIHRFLNLIGGYTASVNTYSHAAAEVLLPHIVGTEDDIIYTQTTWPVMAANTELMVSFGGLPLKNSQINAGGVSQHVTRPGLEQCVANGCEFVNIGPLRSASPAFLNAEWLSPVINTDAAMMLGMAHTLESEGLADHDFLDRCTVGYERFREYLLGDSDGVPKTAEWAAGICGLPAQTIASLARRMTQKRTMITATWSLQRAHRGEQPFWMVLTLAAMLGQIGLPGGGFGFGLTSLHGTTNPIIRRRFASFPQGKNPITPRIPVARISELLLNPGQEVDYDGERITYPDIKLVYWVGGNPFHHHPDIGKLLEAWNRPETIICHELHWNALARHSDIVLPVTGALERNDIMAAASDSAIAPMHKLFEPPEGTRTDYEILTGVADRMGCRDAFTEGRDEMEWLRNIYDFGVKRLHAQGLEMPAFEDFWDGMVIDPTPDRDVERTQYAAFREDPEANPLTTASGKIEIYCDTIASFGYADCPGHATWLEPHEWAGGKASPPYPLNLISDQPKYRLHSQLNNVGTSAGSKINGREPVTLSPQDAAARGIEAGDMVRVYNDRGALVAGAVISDDIAPGAIQLSTGAWFDPAPGRNDTPFCREGNANVLTSDTPTSSLSQAPAPLSAMVEVERFEGDVPPLSDPRPPA